MLVMTHKIWFIDEIIRNILSHLPSNGRDCTLARCGRVSRPLSEPALDLLWRSMSGLVPMLRLFPSSFQEVRAQTGDGGIFVRVRTCQLYQLCRDIAYHPDRF